MITIVPNTTECYAVIVTKDSGKYSWHCRVAITSWVVDYDEETGQLALPASVTIGIIERRGLPHLDDLVGESDHTSQIKEKFIAELQKRDFMWMKDCEQCQKDGTLKRKQERENYFALMEAERIIRMGGKEQ